MRPLSELPDLDLRDRLLVRDDEAWREFHRRFDRLLFHCIERVTGRFRERMTDHDLEEIRAQFFLDLTARDMRRLRAFEPGRGSKLGTWLGMLATNTAWDYVRSTSRQVHRPLDASTLELPSDAVDPVEALWSKQMLARVSLALADLSSRDRDFVRLYFVDGLEAEEVAAAMSISVKTVYSKKHKIRSRLCELGLSAA